MKRTDKRHSPLWILYGGVMMICKSAIALYGGAVIVVGCSSDKEEWKPAATSVSVGANIRNMSSTAPLDPFEANTTIGIFMEPEAEAESETAVFYSAENRCYRKAEGVPATGFLPNTPDQTIYFPINGSAVTFYAYAPHTNRTTKGAVPVDLSVQDPLPLLDLLCADRISGKSATQPDVSFVFRHMLTKLHFDLKPGKGVTEEDLIHTLVEVQGVSTRASFLLANSSLTDRSAPTATVTAKTYTGKAIAEAILLPVEKVDGIVFLFTFKNQMLRYNVPAGQPYVAGAQYNYTVKINGSDELLPLEIECGISDWRNEDYEIEI